MRKHRSRIIVVEGKKRGRKEGKKEGRTEGKFFFNIC